ncbi:DUF4870 domain-containing protein [Candidatus Contubernalis alkaliaceticus]|uniref:DUF4870 domain-containing protein n=1 Tax=Candidatus Contubernalis alkaliaceticus TaxID=338645 RepID=UPI001F4C1B3D|nr:DUF4870 domain-containing protein [Candidatus Contubernalis alkalaceticus]UNC92249.1 DUF4870 domain-containing protein [Candidatus Contubernalis alkalaceticus]
MDDFEKQSRLWGMLCHLSGLLLLTGIPFSNVLGPLIIWLIKKEEYNFVDEQGKEALNFQISITIYGIISSILIILVIGIFTSIALFILYFVLVITASIKTSNGEPYRYPLTIRFIN